MPENSGARESGDERLARARQPDTGDDAGWSPATRVSRAEASDMPEQAGSDIVTEFSSLILGVQAAVVQLVDRINVLSACYEGLTRDPVVAARLLGLEEEPAQALQAEADEPAPEPPSCVADSYENQRRSALEILADIYRKRSLGALPDRGRVLVEQSEPHDCGPLSYKMHKLRTKGITQASIMAAYVYLTLGAGDDAAVNRFWRDCCEPVDRDIEGAADMTAAEIAAAMRHRRRLRLATECTLEQIEVPARSVARLETAARIVLIWNDVAAGHTPMPHAWDDGMDFPSVIRVGSDA